MKGFQKGSESQSGTKKKEYLDRSHPQTSKLPDHYFRGIREKRNCRGRPELDYKGQLQGKLDCRSYVQLRD